MKIPTLSIDTVPVIFVVSWILLVLLAQPVALQCPSNCISKPCKMYDAGSGVLHTGPCECIGKNTSGPPVTYCSNRYAFPDSAENRFTLRNIILQLLPALIGTVYFLIAMYLISLCLSKPKGKETKEE